MSQVAITLIGPGNEIERTIRVKLEGLPDDIDVFEDVKLIPLEAPALVLGVQVNMIPGKDE